MTFSLSLHFLSRLLIHFISAFTSSKCQPLPAFVILSGSSLVTSHQKSVASSPTSLTPEFQPRYPPIRKVARSRPMEDLAKKRSAPSQSNIDRVTRSKGLMTDQLEVPQDLYINIKLALKVEQKLKTNITNEALSLRLAYLKEKIACIANLHKSNGDLPSDWDYHPDTASICVPIKCRQVPAKKKPKKIPRNPHIDTAPLVDKSAKSLWRNFRRLDKSLKTTTLEGLPVPTHEEIKTQLEADSEFVSFIGHFAVDVFNDSCQMYFNNKNISDSKVMDCKYLKVRPCYLFYMTIEAVEQGNLGVYEITLRCNLDDGAIDLDSFFLTDRRPSGVKEDAILESIYETVEDDSTAHEVYYEISGMVRRMTKGGYDYYNPHGWDRWLRW